MVRCPTLPCAGRTAGVVLEVDNFVATVKLLVWVGPRGYCLPRHGSLLFKFGIEGSVSREEHLPDTRLGPRRRRARGATPLVSPSATTRVHSPPRGGTWRC